MNTCKRPNGAAKAVLVMAAVLALAGALALRAAEKSGDGYLGVSVRGLDQAERDELGVSHGVGVVSVEKESGAAAAGILKDDVIQSLNGEKIRDPRSLADAVRELAPGSQVKIGLWRAGKALEVKAALGKRERRQRWNWKVPPFAKTIRSAPYLGIVLLEPDADLAAYFGVKAGAGVLVTGVEKDTPAAKAGLKSGDVIVQMAGKPVLASQDIHEALAALKKGERIAIEVVRHGRKETVQAEPDFDRHQRILRIFGNGGEGEIEHLQLPELDIDVPEIDFEPPCPPEPPHSEEILRHVHEKLDQAKIKIERHLHKIGEDTWI